MLTSKIFLAGIEYLEAAFGYSTTVSQLDIYFEIISPKCTDEQFNEIVKTIVEQETRFPAIATVIRYIPKPRELVM